MKIEILRIDIYKKEIDVKDTEEAEKKLEEEMRNWYDSGDDGNWKVKDTEFDYKEVK